jgi:CHAT domain-containing protein/Tfp pilus assembly protein PilF
MRYARRILPVLFLLAMLVGCGKNEKPATMPPVRDSRAELSDRYAADAEKMAKEAQYRSSNFYLRKAIEIYSEIKEWEKAVQCYIHLGDNYQQLEDFEKAREELDKALILTRTQLGYKHLELAKSFQKIGYKYLSSGQYDRAIEMYEKALLIQLEILGKDHAEVAKTYNSISLAYWNKGDSQRAHQNYNKSFSIKLRQFQGVDFDVKRKYKMLDGKASRKGRFSQARNYFERSLAAYRDSFGNDDYLFAVIYENIGILYAFEGSYDQALQYLRKSFTIRLNLFGDNSPELASSYHNIGICLRLKGEYQDALKFLNIALDFKKETGDKSDPDIADIYYQIGQIHFNYYQDDETLSLEKALSFYQKALVAVSPDFSDSSIFKNPDPAKVLSKDRLLRILAGKAEALKMSYLQNLSRVKELRFAFKTYLLTADLIGEMRRGYKSESYKLFFGEKSHEIYDQAIQTALLLDDLNKDGDPRYREKAFLLSESSKAAVLAEALAESRARRFAGIPDELLETETKLKDELSLYDTLLEKEYQEKENADPRKINSLENQYYKLYRQYQGLIEQFETHYRQYYDLKYNPEPVTVSALRQALDPDTAFVEYFVGEWMIHIFVLTRDGLNTRSIEIDKDFNRNVENFYLAIKKIEENNFSDLSRSLYYLLLDPIRKYIEGKKKLIVIPHGKLYYVPFEALASGVGNAGDLSAIDYAIKRFVFSYHYSARLWLQTLNDGRRRRENKFVGFAPVFDEDPDKSEKPVKMNLKPGARDVIVDGKRFPRLPGTEQEVRAIIDLFKSKGNEAVGYFHRDASEERFKSPEMKNYSIIHVATHSLKQKDNPKLSGLIFTQLAPTSPVQAKPDDGILYSGETYNLDLNAELIVLSSCESGIGKLVKGEGMIALNRGFLYSGVRNTIFSLWKVEDHSTSRLMIELYRNILEGKDFSAALREAKLQLIRDPFTAFPKYWSGFILVGE